MFHPFEENVRDLKEEELTKRIGELSRKFAIASRLGQKEVLTQLQTFVTIYRDELRRRAIAAKLQANDKDLDQLINVD